MLIICLLIGSFTAYLIYFFKKKSEFGRISRVALFALRLISVSLLAFLLLSPMIRTNKKTVLKPVVVIGIDNSSSIVMNADSVFYRNEFPASITNLKESLDDNYDVQIFTFGDRVEVNKMPDFNNATTNISALFKEINTRYFNRNLGAVILATDGIYNNGFDPLYDVRNTRVPIYTINLGDTNSRKDLLIKKVSHNKTAIKGNRFPVEITLQALQLGGSTSQINIFDDNTSIFSAPVTINSNNQIIDISALLQADITGLKKLRVQVNPVNGEINEANNKREIFIEIIDQKQKIAIITEAPHPDIASLQRVIAESNNFESALINVNDFSINKVREFDMVILYQLPGIKTPFKNQLESIISLKIPMLYVIGTRSNIQLFNSLQTGVSFANFKGSFNEALPAINPSFSSFIIRNAQINLLEQAPPLNAPLASYNIANSVNILLSQRIGSTSTNMPLICFNQTLENRTGLIFGEGFWKWRMTDYLLNNVHTNFDDLLSSMFHYLTVQKDKSKFRLDWKNFYAENENIEFSAILLNDSYQPVNDQEITLQIKDEKDNTYNYVFAQENESYQLRIGNLEPGEYSFIAKTNSNGKEQVKTGTFIVTEVSLEDLNLLANHTLLRNIAQESGGESFYPQQIASIKEALVKREDVKPMSFIHHQYTNLIDYYPLMLILFLLLGIEWFVRKYSGSY